MPQLVRPAVYYRHSFLHAFTETDPLATGGQFRPDTDWADIPAARPCADFAGYVQQRRAEADRPPWPGAVMATVLWWVDEAEYLGRISIRHELTEQLRCHGGHIGFAVRPSARQRGHATAMLRAALPWAAELGITTALLTCDVDNHASRRVMEACNGRLVAQDSKSCWYHLETARMPVE